MMMMMMMMLVMLVMLVMVKMMQIVMLIKYLTSQRGSSIDSQLLYSTMMTMMIQNDTNCEDGQNATTTKRILPHTMGSSFTRDTNLDGCDDTKRYKF